MRLASRRRRRVSHGRGKGRAEPEERPGKKFVNIRLIDFGARASGSASGGKAVIRGDAALSLLLFEADSIEYVDMDDGRKPQKIYRGGSRGAFENLTNIREGDVYCDAQSEDPKAISGALFISTQAFFPVLISIRSALRIHHTPWTMCWQ